MIKQIGRPLCGCPILLIITHMITDQTGLLVTITKPDANGPIYTVLFYAEIRAVDSQSDLTILL